MALMNTLNVTKDRKAHGPTGNELAMGKKSINYFQKVSCVSKTFIYALILVEKKGIR